jgi:putative FmdB family regulatory protein
MPIYEYKCDECGTIHEHYCKITEYSETNSCPICNSICRKILSNTAIHVFKPQIVGASITGKDGEDINPYVRNKQELTDAINKYNDTERASKTGRVAILD